MPLIDASRSFDCYSRNKKQVVGYKRSAHYMEHPEKPAQNPGLLLPSNAFICAAQAQGQFQTLNYKTIEGISFSYSLFCLVFLLPCYFCDEKLGKKFCLDCEIEKRLVNKSLGLVDVIRIISLTWQENEANLKLPWKRFSKPYRE